MLLSSLLPPITVLLLQFSRMHFLPGHPELDYLAHFLGGASIAWMFTIIISYLKAKNLFPIIPAWLNFYLLFTTVLLIGVGWEFMETIVEHYTGFPMQFTIPETMGDLAMDMFGGAIFLLLSWSRFFFKKKN